MTMAAQAPEKRFARFRSLRARILAAFLLLTVLPLLLLGILAGRRSTTALEHQSLTLLRELRRCQTISERIHRRLRVGWSV